MTTVDDAAPSSSFLDEAAGALPGVGAALACGALSLDLGPGPAAALAGALAVPLGLASAAAASLRASRASALGPGLALTMATPAVAVFAALLKANTHHKALAGVTFALISLGIAAGGLVVGARARQIAGERPWAGALASAAAAAALSLLALKSAEPGSLPLDLLLGVAALAGGWLLGPRRSRALGLAGAGALGAALLGVALAGGPHAARAAQRSALAAGLLGAASPPTGELAQPGKDH